MPFIFLLVASLVIFLRRVNVFPLRNWDEAWYAEAVKNMASGQYGYLMQFWNGRYYFDHSPLYFWLSTPIFKIFGPGEWQARVVSIVAAVFSVVLIYLIGRKLKSETAGILSALVFLTIGGVVIRFAHGNLDSLLVCLFLASFYFYLKRGEKWFLAVCSGLSLGFGILVKSWGIGLFPIFWIFTHVLFVERKFPSKFLLMSVSMVIAFLWWYVLGVINFGNNFINWFVLNPSEGRLDSPLGNFSLDYYKFALNDVGLWILAPVIYFAMLVRRKVKIDHNIAPFLTVVAIYVTVLNFLSDKSGWYLIPAYPLIAIVVGLQAEKILKSGRRLLFWVSFIFLLSVGWWNVLRIENIYPDRSIVGAQLGLKAKELIPFEDEVILEDHDFTSFLYYSNQNHIYTLQNEKKSGEWWILTHDELNGFLNNNPRSWIVTRSADKYPQMTMVGVSGEYYFLRNY